MKRNFMRRIKRKCNKEFGNYYRKMNVLYELFNNFYIADCEFEIFTFIKTMSICEIEKMFDDIILELDKYDMVDGITENPSYFKFAVMIYIQKMRNGEYIET